MLARDMAPKRKAANQALARKATKAKTVPNARLVKLAAALLAARAVAGAAAFKRGRVAAAPKGMGRITPLKFAANDQGIAINALTQAYIPTRRAVRIGKQWYDSDGLRALLKFDRKARNPLTREPLPREVVTKYGPKVVARAPLPQQRRMSFADRVRAVESRSVALIRESMQSRGSDPHDEFPLGRTMVLLRVMDNGDDHLLVCSLVPERHFYMSTSGPRAEENASAKLVATVDDETRRITQVNVQVRNQRLRPLMNAMAVVLRVGRRILP